jgi:integrase
MAIRIDTVKARELLKARHGPYWQRIRKGCFLGVRKTVPGTAGTWLARHRDDETGRQVVHSLGHLDDVSGADRFDAARVLADAWFLHRGAGGSEKPKTVANACDDYVKSLHDASRNKAADDVIGRFKRWVYADAKLANTVLLKLTPKALEDWRRRLARSAVRRAPKKVPDSEPRPRSASALNRDMTSLRAALNLALENGHAASDHAWRTKLRPVKDADGRRDIYLDAGQRRALIAHAPADLANFLRALSQLPLRPGAMATLKVSAFDSRLATLAISKDKAGSDRRIGLPSATAEFLTDRCKGKRPDQPLLSRADGSAWNKDAWKKPLKQAARRAGLPEGTVAYALRHSAITDLIALHRLDTMTVAQLAGTSLLMIEKNYGHLLREHARSALAGLVLEQQVSLSRGSRTAPQ